MKYPVVAVIWEDHVQVQRDDIPANPDSQITMVISFGIIAAETDKTILLVSDIERYGERDDGSYLIIMKNSIVSTKEFDKIDIENIRFAP